MRSYERLEMNNGTTTMPRYEAGTLVAVDRIKYVFEHDRSFSDNQRQLADVVVAERHREAGRNRVN